MNAACREHKQYWANVKFVSAVSIFLDILNLLIKYKFFVISLFIFGSKPHPIKIIEKKIQSQYKMAYHSMNDFLLEVEICSYATKCKRPQE